MTTTEVAPRPATVDGEGPAVLVRGLVKRYGGRAVLDGLDLEVRRGECFALLGPNGAGKTTTIEVLEGVRSRDAGSVTVLGEDPARAGRGWRARLGVVSQGEPAGQALTVRETLDHFAAYTATPRSTGDLLEAVGLNGQAGTRVGRLSGGQRRRLAVALGVQGRPDLVFLDEPTTGMDPAVEAPTARELQVLAGVARGLTNSEIGRELFIGEATVKTHLLRVFAKFGVDDRTRAVLVAVERGLLAGPGAS
jgi:ABC-2 type transport system ATP-binding protein